MNLPVRHLALYVTEACNLACAYCFASQRAGRHTDPGVAERALRLVLGPANAAPTVTVTFWGGEPLLQFDAIVHLVDLAEQVARKNGKRVRFALPTNTTLLHEDHIAFFQAHRVALSLSLDGDAAAQALRPSASGKSTVPVVTEKVALIARRYTRRPPVRMTVSPQNVEAFEHNARFFLEQGFDRLYFAPAVEAEWSDAAFAAFSRGQAGLVTWWVRALESGRAVGFDSWDRALAAAMLQEKGLLPRDLRLPCGAGASMLAVDIHGRFFPCHRFVFYDPDGRLSCLGHVDQGLPGSDTRTAYAQMTRSRFRTRSVACQACPRATQCMQFCPALNLKLTGDLFLVDERLCRFARIEAEIVEEIRERAATSKALAAYLDRLEARAIRGKPPAEGTPTWYTGLEEQDVDRIAGRAATLLDHLRARRRKASPGHEPSNVPEQRRNRHA